MKRDDRATIEIAGRYLGFDPTLFAAAAVTLLDEFEVSAPLVEGPQTAAAWRIDLGIIPIALASLERRGRSWQGRCSAILEASTGRLLEAVIETEVPGKEPLRPITREVARAGLAAHGERYTALASDPPNLALLAALDIIESAGYASAAQAARVHAVLVVHEWLEQPLRPVWAITLEGLRPWPVSAPAKGPAPDVPVWQRNHLRHVIDAASGEVLFATTIPQPVGV